MMRFLHWLPPIAVLLRNIKGYTKLPFLLQNYKETF